MPIIAQLEGKCSKKDTTCSEKKTTKTKDSVRKVEPTKCKKISQVRTKKTW
jgi:hypothetical protein